MRWVLHALTFFKHYMTTSTAALAEQYASLDGSQKVGPWKANIKAGAMAMGKKWKGAYGMFTLRPYVQSRDVCHMLI